MMGIEMKLNIPVHYQMGNPLQQGRTPSDGKSSHGLWSGELKKGKKLK
jgi:hypothetical protein